LSDYAASQLTGTTTTRMAPTIPAITTSAAWPAIARPAGDSSTGSLGASGRRKCLPAGHLHAGGLQLRRGNVPVADIGGWTGTVHHDGDERFAYLHGPLGTTNEERLSG
jgi:hypothetical protein